MTEATEDLAPGEPVGLPFEKRRGVRVAPGQEADSDSVLAVRAPTTADADQFLWAQCILRENPQAEKPNYRDRLRKRLAQCKTPDDVMVVSLEIGHVEAPERAKKKLRKLVELRGRQLRLQALSGR